MTEKDAFQIIKEIDKVNQTMKKLCQTKKQFTVIIGGTGQGKSTLTNYIHGVKLQYQKKSGGSYHIFAPQSSNNDPKIQIGNSKGSCTKVPSIYDFNGAKSADLIGWLDTQDPKQQIINGFANSYVLNKGKKIRIVIVCSINTFQIQRGGNFVKIIKILHDVFKKDFVNIADSVLIVFSKVNVYQWTQEGICQQMDQILSFNKNLNQDTKIFLKNTIQKKRVAIFPTPDKINQTHISKIKYMINNLKQVILEYNSNVSLSPQAIKLKDKLQQLVLQKSTNMKDNYQNLIKNKYLYRDYQFSYQMNYAFQKLKEASKIIQKIFNNRKDQMGITIYDNHMLKLYEKLNYLLGGDKKNFDLIKYIKVTEFCYKINNKFKGFQRIFELLLNQIKNTIIKLNKRRTNLENKERQKKEKQEKQEQIRLELQRKRRYELEKQKLRLQQLKFAAQQKALQEQYQKQIQAKLQKQKQQQQMLRRQIQAAQIQAAQYRAPAKKKRRVRRLR